MPDKGNIITDFEYRRLLKELNRIYGQAAEELRKKLEDFNRKWAMKDAQKRALRDAGQISEAEYREWVSHQVFTSELWQEKADEAARMLSRANAEAAALVHQGRLTAFAANANYTLYRLEHGAAVNTGFTLYSRESVSRLVKNSPQLLPEWKIDQPKDYIWNYNRVKNSITQGIIQGKPIPEITKDMVSQLQTGNEAKMRNFARTGMTGAQNAGRMDMLHRQQSLGIRVRKKWVATKDSRTRDAHADLDGQIRDVDEPFEAENRDGSTAYIDYPGDPAAPAEQVYNCRCTMTYVYPDLDDPAFQALDHDPEAPQLSYEDWLERNENREAVQHTSNPYRR